jgi:hypothetical protein
VSGAASHTSGTLGVRGAYQLMCRPRALRTLGFANRIDEALCKPKGLDFVALVPYCGGS